MRKKIKKIADLVLVVGFLGFIFVMPMMTICTGLPGKIKDIRETKTTLKTQGMNYKDLSRKIKDIRDFEIYGKTDFINLNGLVARCLGMNSLNRRQKLANGYLTGFSGARDVEEGSRNVAALNRFLADRGIPFLYVLAPSKNALYDTPFAPGYGDDSKQNITNMIQALNSAGVETINMDAWFKENGWHYEDVFFKTDHHWLPEAGLAAAKCAMDLLQKKGAAEYDIEKFSDEGYTKIVLKEWFLGSQGKGTGKFYSGVDNISDYRPNFKTDYSYATLKVDTTDWDYSDKLIDPELAKTRDLFGSDSYSVFYLGKESALKIISNLLAVNKKRLMVIGDSFSRTFSYFLTTQFTEIHRFDLRYLTDGTFAQYIGEIKPDVVIMCVNSGGVRGKHYEYGVDEYLTALAKTDPNSPVQNLGNFELRAEEENKNKFSVVCGNLEPNQAYTLTVDRTALRGVEHSFVQMTLQNLSTNKAIFNRYFESNSGARQKWIFTTPEGDDAYGIFLYAGTKGHTSGIDAKVEGIALRKGIFED